ncbi:hypothetical protein ACHHYP_14823 [Achlya hypogyna]|uniref:Uncharacterized protein n=1 Tax=Achlya hypogyna TaxID=1202772 RepID=A0A1V9YCD1_ACHHY|nr:hypothetical protein ACHHYP_14823 [Achlya hypogyna]
MITSVAVHKRLRADFGVVFTIPKIVNPWKYQEAAHPEEHDERPKSPVRLSPLAHHPALRRRSPKPARKRLTVAPLRDAPQPSTEAPILARLVPILGDQVGDIYTHVEAIHIAHVRKLHEERAKPSCVFSFNEQAAVQPELLRQRHEHWCDIRDQREEDCHVNRERRRTEYMEHAQAQTTEFRRQMRERVAAHAAHQVALQRVLAPLLAGAAAQMYVATLRTHWAAAAQRKKLVHYARKWRAVTQSQVECARHAAVLRTWLRESAKVKTIALKVFYGLRVFTRKVTLVQSFWRRRKAEKRTNHLRLARLWDEFELIEPPKPELPVVVEPEASRPKRELERKKSRKKSKKVDTIADVKKPYPMLPYPYPKFEPALRAAIIREVLVEHDAVMRLKFRALEDDLYPFLVECLQGLHKDASRSVVREMARRHLVLGSVFVRLTQVPGALDATTIANYAELSLRSIDMLAVLHRANERVNPALYMNVGNPESPPQTNRRGSDRSVTSNKSGHFK